MERTSLAGWLMAAVCGVAMVLAGHVASAGDFEKEIVIVGTVVAVQWDEEGNVVDVEIETDTDVYLVELEGLGTSLLEYAGEVVSIRGRLYTDEDGWTVVHVISFTVVEEPEA